MTNLRFFVYPAVGAFLGFITNFIAIKLLFHPKRRILGVQGLLPRRKQEIADRAGAIVNEHLVNSDEIRRKMDRRKMEQAVESFLRQGNTPFLDVSIVKVPLQKFLVALLIDRDGFFNRRIIEAIIDRGMVSDIVREKIGALDIDGLEDLVKQASGPEFRFILLSGACLGFIIGLSQAFIGL